MSFLLALLTTIGIGSLLVGFLVYFKDPKNSSNKTFAIFSVVVLLWIASNYLADNPIKNEWALFWNRLNFASAITMAVVLFYFSFVFPSKSTFPLIGKVIYFFISLLIIFLILFTGLGIKTVELLNWGTNAVSGPLFRVGIILSVGSIVGLLINISLKFRKSNQSEKMQLKYLIYGIVISALMGLTTNALIPALTKSYEFAKYGPISMVLLLGFIAYAIIKHHLFNIRIILTEIGTVIINLILLIQMLLSKTIGEAFIRGVFFLIVFYGSYILVQSVKHEIKQREELQVLSQDLAHANEHLKELDRMKTEFVSLASHELLTPVSAIEGYLSMTLDEKMAKIDDPKAVKYMDRVYTSAKRLARLVTDMLNVSRIEEGRLLVEKHDINLNDLINQVIDELKFKAEEKKQKIVFADGDQTSDLSSKSAEDRSPKTESQFLTFGDPDKIKEVIVNLIGNSIKYSKNPGTIIISTENVPTAKVQEKWQKIEEDIKTRPLDDQEAIKSAIDERLKRLVGDEQILIHVKDQGVGIPKEELPRLFKKFHRVGDYTTAESQGTGLGLYISRALVELHHGRIWASSEGPSHGSTFTFSLPDISSKQAIIDLEAQIPQPKEQLKPLARPTKEAEEI